MDRKRKMTEEELIQMREQVKDDLIWKTYSHGVSMKDVCFIAESDRERVYSAVVAGIVKRLIQKAERIETGGIEQLERLKARLDDEMSVLRREDEEAVMRSRAELVELNRKLEEMDRELEETHRDFQKTLDETLEMISDDSCGSPNEAVSDDDWKLAEDEGDAPDDCGGEKPEPDAARQPAGDGPRTARNERWAAFKSRCRGFLLSDFFSHICIGVGTVIIVAACAWGVGSAVHDLKSGHETVSPVVAEYRTLANRLDRALMERDEMVAALEEIGGDIEALMELYGEGVEVLSAKQAEIAYLDEAMNRTLQYR